MDTRMKAAKVPMLTSSASVDRGTNVARIGDRDSGEDGEPVRGAEARMGLGKRCRQQVVAGHGEADARLAKEQDHAHHNQPDAGSDGDEVCHDRQAHVHEGRGQRCAVGRVDVLVVLHAGDDQ